MPLEFSPGTAFNYSVSTDVVGYLVGKISGQPFEQFLRTRIIDPLGMSGHRFHGAGREGVALRRVLRGNSGRTHDVAGRSADERLPASRPASYPAAAAWSRPRPTTCASAGCCSTAARSTACVCVSPKTLELMSMNHLPGGKELPDLSVSLFSEATYGGVGFGLGFAVSMSPARAMIPGSPGDVSWGGLASTYFWVDPRERLIVIFMTQLMPSATYPIRRELRTLVYSAFT